MPKVSIIVPVFNVEKYLKRCLESLISQTFKDIEIILVNDGSTDNSKNICEQFVKKDSRIILINKENAGVSSARNFGIEHSKGKYISFVDADDYVSIDMIDFLVKNLEKNKADISTCGHYNCYFNDDSIEKCYFKNSNDSGILDSRQSLQESLIGRKISLMPCDKLFKRELFDEIRFPVGVIYEDSAVIPKIMTKISKVYYSFIPKYYYVQRQNSITNSKFSYRNFDVIKVNKQNYDMVKNHYQFAIKHAEFRLLWSYLTVIDRIVCSDFVYPEINSILNIIKKNKFNILGSKFFTLKRKMLTGLLILNFGIYKKVIKHYKKCVFYN